MSLPINQIVQGNCLQVLKTFTDESIDMVMFSPPYWGLRCYGKETEAVYGGNLNCEHEWVVEKTEKSDAAIRPGPNSVQSFEGAKQREPQRWESGFCVKCGAWKGQLGLEPTPQLYVEHLVMICRELKRVLKKTGSMYIVLGDTFYGSGTGRRESDLTSSKKQLTNRGFFECDEAKDYIPHSFQSNWLRPKQQLNMPFHVAFALQQDGWIQRDRAIWHKNNAMPGSQKDRLTCSYEFIFRFVKNDKTILWRNMETGEWRNSRPVQQYVKEMSGLRVATTERPTVLRKLLSECSKSEREERKLWHRMWMGFDYYYELDAIREPPISLRASGNKARKFPNRPIGGHLGHSIPWSPFNLRVRDVKRGKGGVSAFGTLKASPQEIEGYAYPESGRMRRLVQRLYEIHQRIRGEGYGGKHSDLPQWKEAAANAKAFRDALKLLEQDETLSDLEAKFLKDYVQNHLGHPLGRNPGDVLKYGSKYEQHSYGQTLQAFIREQSVAKRRAESRREAEELFPNDPEKQREYIQFIHDHDSHPLGPNPRDVIKTQGETLGSPRARTSREGYDAENHFYHPEGKNPGDVVSDRVRSNLEHFLPKGSGGHYAYGGLDSKEAKHEHPLGKNPSDVTKIGTHHGSSLSGEGRATHTKGQSVENHPLGNTPRDTLKYSDENEIHKRSFADWKAHEPRTTHPLGAAPDDFWSINTKPFKGAHFAVYPVEICRKPILSSAPPDGIVLDPMAGSGSTLVMAKMLGRKFVGIEINGGYVEIAKRRLADLEKSEDKKIGKSAGLDSFLEKKS